MNLLKCVQNGNRGRAWFAALALAASVGVSHAIPFASGVKLEGGVLTFTLNENAQGVKVIAGAVTKDLGALSKGTIVTNLGISGAFRIEVSNSTAGGWAQTSVDTNILVRFNSPRGVAVNNNPASPYFGRVYIANSAAGTTTGVVRSVGDGIYVLNADQSDALGQGNTALNGGANFSAGGTSSPYRVSVGQDGNLYICDWSDAAGNLIVVDPNLSTGSAKFVLKPLAATTAPGNASVPIGLNNTHGSIAAAAVTGSLADGTLTVYAVDEDHQTDREATGLTEMNSLWVFNIGAGPLPSSVEATEKLSTPSVAFVSQTMDMTRGPNGYLYVTIRRSNGSQNGLQVVDPTDPDPFTRIKFMSMDASMSLGGTNDYFFGAGGVSISADGKSIAVYRYDNNEVVVAPLIDGIPDLVNRVVFPAFGTTAAGRAIAFDAAGNLHIVSSGYGLYRVYSPGGTTVATTTSDGQFNVVTPLSSITVAATVADTAEGGSTAGEFTLTRSGATGSALTVNVALSGDASNGTDYNTIAGTVTFPVGQSTVTIPVTAINDSISEAAEKVTLTVQGSPNYTAGNPGVATVTIADNDTPMLSLSTSYDSAYERVTDDYIQFKVTRLGDLTAEVTANVSLSGPGASGATGPATVTIPAAAASATFEVHPVDNSALDGNRAVTATLEAGAGYTVGTAAASGTIIDDEMASEAGKVLFADNFDTDSSANWKVLFGAGNNIDDQLIAFGYDFVGLDGIPAAPGGSTTGLKMTVNKFDGTTLGSAAGLNAYPKGKTFSGDFAVRFNMYLLMNSGAGTTEHALVGINTSGNKTNWVRQTAASVENNPQDADGIWAAVVADGSLVNALGHVLYTGNGATQQARVLANVDPLDLTPVFKSPPYLGTTGLSGAPANTTDSATKNWVDVELKQVAGVVTLSINKSVILNYTNTTTYTSGDLMLGYNDQFDSIGDVGAVYFDNLRVVDLTTAPPTQPAITSITVNGGNVVVNFTGGTADEAAAFTLQGKSAITGAFAAEAATITKVSAGQFRATIAASGNVRFYRISR